ncbi:MAG: DUF2306 domain-containing protein [Caulobacterales bacterium]|nr:DUF2306 domain-containing protein [Caulobacterales bacterium]
MPPSPSHRPSHETFDRILRGSGVAWFCVAAVGQAAFIAFILAFYGVRTVMLNFAAWNDKPLIDGYIAGDSIGNLVFALHVLPAAVMTMCGLMQLTPQLRRARPRLHRWTGRIFLTLAVIEALSGVWLTVVRGTYLSQISAIAILLDAALILIFAGLTLWNAVKRRIERHRIWAMRTFMVASGVWFLRVGIMGWILINQGPVGMNDHMSGPADVVLTFGAYLIPLAILELYLIAGRSQDTIIKALAALTLLGATLFTALGVFGTVALMWLPYLP